jgi:hypothetical protein
LSDAADDERFARVDPILAKINERFDQLERLIVAEGEKTRRYMDSRLAELGITLRQEDGR